MGERKKERKYDIFLFKKRGFFLLIKVCKVCKASLLLLILLIVMLLLCIKGIECGSAGLKIPESDRRT